jgi:hypothetical protein
MLRRRILIRYGLRIALREFERSSRLSAQTRVTALAGIGAIYSLTAYPLGVTSYLYWLLTGRGLWRRWGLGTQVVINPFPRAVPSDVAAALASRRAGLDRPCL